ncbi:hypothetical protein GJ496_011990 [Pomphorhynchus laevis]|nr:hypothetical protein GJ496_011990 [Pomphorhynchus laevis]
MKNRIPETRENISENKWHREFVRLIRNGKIRRAMKLLETGTNQSGLHRLCDMIADDSVRQVLQHLHPDAKAVEAECILKSTLPDCKDHHHTIFFSIDKDAIRSAAKRTRGSCGPSGRNAVDWCDVLH